MDVMEMFRLIYQEELPPDIGPMRELLQDYSDIKPNQIESHLYKIVRPQALVPTLSSRRLGPAFLRLCEERDVSILTSASAAKASLESNSISLYRPLALPLRRPAYGPALPGRPRAPDGSSLYRCPTRSRLLRRAIPPPAVRRWRPRVTPLRP